MIKSLKKAIAIDISRHQIQGVSRQLCRKNAEKIRNRDKHYPT